MSKLEVLQEKPWYVQAALIGAAGLLAYLGFWYFVTSGTRAETAKVEGEVAQLKRANAGAQIAAQRLSEFKANYARAQADYDDLKALLPEQRELTMVLHNIQERARGHLTLRRFTPRDEVQQDFYSGKPVEIAVSGSYNELGKFFAQMASYQRIVSITDFKIERPKDDEPKDGRTVQTVDAQFLLTAYYAPPEQLQAMPPPDAQKPKAKGKGKKAAEDKEKGKKGKKEAD